MWLLAPSIARAQEGTWTDGTHTYVFLKNNVFKFTGRAATKDGGVGTAEGVWQSSPGLCWRGDNKGSVMIYVETLQCCMQAMLLGGKLVLSEVWQKGSGIVGPSLYGVCENRVLNKAK